MISFSDKQIASLGEDEKKMFDSLVERFGIERQREGTVQDVLDRLKKENEANQKQQEELEARFM
jgi:predicted  nucleic acid-binding Zn-ribbon protein